MMNFCPFTNDRVGVLRTCLKLIQLIKTMHFILYQNVDSNLNVMAVVWFLSSTLCRF